MDSDKPEARSTNFDSDAEDGELSKSPVTSNGEPRIVPADVMKGTERDCGEFIMDRTESIDVNDNDVSSQDSSQSDAGSAWLAQITSGLLADVDEAQKAEEPEEPPKKRSRAACFNCGGPHQLSQCSEPRDPKRIREAAAEFKERRRMQETGRYTDEKKKDEGSDFRPGRISSALREALGIGSDDIPEWIYRMRRLGFCKGYPPAYLKQAIVSQNKPGEVLEFHLIDADGDQEMKHEDEGRETPPPELDGNKMFFYMGFNKTYRSLRDREGNFRIPPWEDYVRFNQEELTKKYWSDRDRRRTEKRDRQRNRKEEAERKSKELLEENDIVVLDTVGSFKEDPDCVVVEPPKEDENKDGEADAARPVTPLNAPQEPSSSTTPKGTTITTIPGTPVMIRKNEQGQDIHNSLPALDAFSKGITPFEAKEEGVNPNRGLMKELLGKIRNSAGKK